LFAGLTSTEADALAAARPGLKATSARTARARRSTDPPSAVRRSSDGSKVGTPVSKETPTRERGASQEKNAARSAERGAKSASEATANPKLAPTDTRAATPSEGTKAPIDAAPSRSGDGTQKSPENSAHRSADATANRGTGAAKSPSENARSAPSEKPMVDAPTEATDGSRSALEAPAPGSKRELASASSATNGTAPAARPVVVMLEGPVFDGGDVPRAATALERMKAGFSRCAAVENALTKNEASIDLRFLVRAPGRAEGVDVDKARGVSSDVVRCMTSVLARSYIGAPSDDPVGVAVTVRVKRAEPGSN
jgi:hypothetical protein